MKMKKCPICFENTVEPTGSIWRMKCSSCGILFQLINIDEDEIITKNLDGSLTHTHGGRNKKVAMLMLCPKHLEPCSKDEPVEVKGKIRYQFDCGCIIFINPLR